MELLNEWYFGFETYFKANPDRAWMILGIVLLVVSILNFIGKVDPSNTRQRIWLSFLGSRKFGKIMGFIFLIGSLLSFYLSFVY